MKKLIELAAKNEIAREEAFAQFQELQHQLKVVRAKAGLGLCGRYRERERGLCRLPPPAARRTAPRDQSSDWRHPRRCAVTQRRHRSPEPDQARQLRSSHEPSDCL